MFLFIISRWLQSMVWCGTNVTAMVNNRNPCSVDQVRSAVLSDTGLVQSLSNYDVTVCQGKNYACILYLSRLMGKPTICIGENKGADQLRGNREADQRLCFRYSDSTIPLLLKSEISSF